MLINTEKIQKAITLACIAHDGQVRISGKNEKKIPYISHPLKVATKVCSTYLQYLSLSESSILKIEEVTIAAILHDVIEDTEYTIEQIIEEFGDNVAKLVLELTSDTDKIKEMGKAEYLAQKINHMSPDALIIKLCDRLDNISDLKSESNSFSDRYYNETIKIVNMLDKNIYTNEMAARLLVRIAKITDEYRMHRKSQGIDLL